MIAFLRRLRHGPLAFFGSFWLFLGDILRFFLRKYGRLISVSHHIGSYGPFKMDGIFAFSDFEHWGDKHNNGFNACIESCRDKHCLLDVGGHIGLVTMPASTVLAPGGKVYVFEPAEANLKHLISHVNKNNLDNVVIEKSLVGATEKIAVKFYEQSIATGQNALAVKKNHELYSETTRPQIMLDKYCSVHNIKPEVIKIDVEGAEHGVLTGAKNIIKKYKPIIFLSLHPTELKLLDSSVKEVVEFVENELEYTITEIDGSKIKEFRLSEYLLKPKSD